MHAASVALLSWAMIGAACFVPNGGAAAVSAALAALVALIGLPHGAADHRFARPRLEPLLGSSWAAAFLIGYLLVAACVVLGWFVAPAATIVLFFIASAWHFGHEEPRLSIGPSGLRPVFRFARGGLVMWATVALQRDEVSRILLVTSPAESGQQIQSAVTFLSYCSWFFLGLAAVAWGLQSLAALAGTGRKRRVLLADNALVASLAVLFALASPLVGFLVYFCAWHSARGLRRLRRELGESWSQLIGSLAPMTGAAIALIAGMTVLFLRLPSWDATLVRATFIGISALAVPHLLLHSVDPLVAYFGSRRQLGPSMVGGAA